MHVILVRHGRPEIVVDSPTIADPSLDEIGRWQAERLTAWLACEEIDAVITSPKARAIQTAVGTVEGFGLTPRIVNGLDEIDRGAHTYLPTELLPTQGGAYWDQICEKRYDEIGWDSPEAFRDRVVATWDDLCRNPPGERVLVACHGGTIRTILAHVAGNDGAGFRLDYTSISRVEVTPPGGDPSGEDGPTDPYCSVASANEVAHFDAERTAVVGAFRGAERPGTTFNRRPLSAPTS
ncbi:MAG: histidine phosphatase family protein [Acidimicrobiaceae bacterium]|nr:histidine phosphatase family protein [Acidimicrobiaceae bacterium]